MLKVPMWDKQVEALKFCIKRGQKGVCLLMEMGTGKTRVAIHWIEYLYGKKGVRLGFVAAPLSVLHVWVTNWNDWSDIPCLFIDIHETGSEGLRIAEEYANAGHLVICLINYELAWQLGYRTVEIVKQRTKETVRQKVKVDTELADIGWDFGILDEATAIKTPGSRVSKYFRDKVRQMTVYRMAMTGSAYTKRPVDTWAIVKWATQDEVFPGPFAPFRSIFAVYSQQMKHVIVGWQNIPYLVQNLARCCVLLKKEDVIELPPFSHSFRYLNLPPKAEELYDRLKKEMYLELLREEEEWRMVNPLAEDEGKRYTVSASHVFALCSKLPQIASGFLTPDIEYPEGYDPDVDPKIPKPKPIRVETEKIEELIRFLEERGGKPTVIVVNLDEEEIIVSEAIKAAFKFTPKILNGGVHKFITKENEVIKGTAEARDAMIREAANDPAFIVKMSVGCRGTDMRWSDCILFYSHNYDTEEYEQMLSRNHRGGVKHQHISYVHFIVKKTIEEQIMRTLTNDLSLARMIESDWRALFLDDEGFPV